MTTRWQRQRLEHTIEVVDDAGVEAVDIDSGLFRRDLDADVGATVIDRELPVRVGRPRPPGIPSEHRIVEVAANEYMTANDHVVVWRGRRTWDSAALGVGRHLPPRRRSPPRPTQSPWRDRCET